MNSLRQLILTLILIVIHNTFLFAQQEEGSKRMDLLKSLKHQDSIVYKTVDGKELLMTFFYPTNKIFAKDPVMIFTHGGGWSGGDRYVILKKNFSDPMQDMLDKGIACVSIQYRLTKGESSIGDAIADCKDAGRFLVKNAAKFGIDTARMGVWGGSAGGHLSLMTGLASNNLFLGDAALASFAPSYKCIVSYFPQTTFIHPEVLSGTKYFSKQKLTQLFQKDGEIPAEVGEAVSPVNYVSKANPPVLILHGTADPTLSYKNATLYMETARKAGANAKLLTVVDGKHGLTNPESKPSPEEVSKVASGFAILHLLK